jgi:hypothetical protein
MKNNGVFKWPKYFTKKLLKPDKFLGGMSGGNIFGLDGGQSHKFKQLPHQLEL